MGDFETIAEIMVEPATARVYEHGWQSWSPSASWAATDAPARPTAARNRVIGYRPGDAVPAGVFQGEGLLAVRPSGRGETHVFGVERADREVASIRAVLDGNVIRVSADGPVRATVDRGPGDLQEALARWADGFADRAGVRAIRRAPTIWCSWYHYFTRVTEADMDENLATMGELDLPVDVVQLDDGYEAEIGDWLALSGRFASLDGLIERIRGAGRRAGIWVAPFLVGAKSETARLHPDWLVRDDASGVPVSAGFNWDQELYALDATQPAARAYLTEVFTRFRGLGIDFFKIDFIYAGAIPGRRHDPAPTAIEAYRSGVELIRAAIGDAYLLGCGAPILPSVGLVDAMRISPDTAPHWEPLEGDLSKPGGRSSILTGAGRAFQQGRFWVNDPDCIVARPAIEHREELAEHVARFGGLRGSSDRLADLDAWGLATTRRLLADSPVEPFISSGAAGVGSSSPDSAAPDPATEARSS
jgi:alpha-galactosidase